jgi:c-di-AMP phosphodiesterase-like protein
MSETPEPEPARFRIRWGWFVGCIVLGLIAILIGWWVASADDYLAGVLADIGATLLLVGIVVLLERRIIDSAVRVVRRANEQANDAIRAQIKDLDDRISAEWANATVENIAEKQAETVRLTDEFTKRVVDESKRYE